MFGDLDEERHGFSWWHGHLDARRIAVMSEYVIASVGGVSTALVDAEFVLEEHRAAVYSHDAAIRLGLNSLGEAALSEDVLKVIYSQDPASQKRVRRARLAAEHTTYHLAQALDRLAAVLVGVSALDTPLLQADWRSASDKNRWKRALGPQPDSGRLAQRRLLEAIGGLESEPTDWLPWMDRQRNTLAHRAPRLSMMFQLKGERGRPGGFFEPFFRQPGWSETEMLAANNAHPEQIWLMEAPNDVLAGLVRSTADLCGQAADLMLGLWMARRSEPDLLIQPGGQWPEVFAQPKLEFPGYGSAVSLAKADSARVAPETARRMKAAGLFSRTLWNS
jgi:hypothetical protein